MRSESGQDCKRFPKKMMMSGSMNGSDLSIEIGIKKLIYFGESDNNDQFFQTDYCVEEMGYLDQG